MRSKTGGIVLHALKYNDAAIITRIYTRDFGLVSFLVKGLHGKKSKFRPAHFQPLTLLEMEMEFKENRSIQTLKEIYVSHASESVHTDTAKISAGLFLAELVLKSVKEQAPNDYLYDFMVAKIEELEWIHPYPPCFHLTFMVRICMFLGFLPEENYTSDQPYFSIAEGKFTATHHQGNCMDLESSKALSILLNRPDNYPVLSLESRRKLMQELLKFFSFHIPGFGQMKTVSVLEEVFS